MEEYAVTRPHLSHDFCFGYLPAIECISNWLRWSCFLFLPSRAAPAAQERDKFCFLWFERDSLQRFLIHFCIPLVRWLAETPFLWGRRFPEWICGSWLLIPIGPYGGSRHPARRKTWELSGAARQYGISRSIVSLPGSLNGLSPSSTGSDGFDVPTAFAPFPFLGTRSRICIWLATTSIAVRFSPSGPAQVRVCSRPSK